MIARARLLSIATLVAAMASSGAASAKPRDVAPAAQPFSLGAWTIVALRDADNVLPNDGKVFGASVKPDDVARVLKAAGAPTDEITLGVDALLVKAPDRVMLFDSGLGPSVHGALMGSLAKAGVPATDVSDIMITHSHFDHVGGLVTAEGGLAFPKATVHMSTKEWAWMQTQPSSQAIVKVIAPHVKTFEPGATVLPGVTSIGLEGHTPGHVGYEIGTGADKIVDIGDTAHSSIVSLAEPDWAIGYDTDATEGETTRRSELKTLADNHTRIFAPHFPFPGVGRIEASGDHFAFRPEQP